MVKFKQIYVYLNTEGVSRWNMQRGSTFNLFRNYKTNALNDLSEDHEKLSIEIMHLK